MKYREKGGAKLWVFIFCLLGAGTYVGYQIGQLQFDQSTIVNEVAAIADQALTSLRANDESVKKDVRNLMARYDVDLTPDEIEVSFSGGKDRVRIRFQYTRFAKMIVTSREENFTVNVERASKKAAGMIQDVQNRVEESDRKADENRSNAYKNATGEEAP